MSFAALLLATTSRGALVISEFVAQNNGGLADADGETPDWIELRNNGASAMDLTDWYLTDNATNLTKWKFPATNIASSAYLVIFASGKNRTNAGAELHTSFQLNEGGGYIALVMPDGVTIADSVTYPNQRANVSFGVARQVAATPLLSTGATARYLVPSNDTLGTSWTSTAFDDSGWSNTTTPLTYTLGLVPGNTVLAVDFNERAVDPVANTQSGFQSFVINSNVSATAVQTQAVTRTFGAITVTLSNTAPLGYDDRLRSTPANSGSFTDGALLRDFVFSREVSGNGGLDVTITGLSSNANYQFTVWSFDASSPGGRCANWFANGTLVKDKYRFNGSAPPTSNNDYKFTFAAMSDALGRILLSGRRDSTSTNASGTADLGVFLNAFQIDELSTAPGAGLASQMYSNNATAYLRVPFTIVNVAAINELVLRTRYDDGFVAYINGQLVASRNAPASPTWNSAATAAHSAAVAEDITLIPPAGLLVNGANMFAVHALNVAATDIDLFLEPQVIANQVTEITNRFFAPPTPGANNSLGYTGFVADTKFSVDRGFYETPFSLSITCATASATIYYTTNGSAPSPNNGAGFTAAINITGNSFIRAAAFAPGLIPSDVDTHSYIFLRDVLSQSNAIPGYPTVWQASYPADYAMDSNIVRHVVYGATISNDLRSIPSLCLVADQAGLWSSSTGIYPNPTSIGDAWERAASLELIRGDGHSEFATTAKIQVHGNASRDNVRTPKHSIGVSFSSDYGPTKLRYNWFDGGVKVHDKIVLRSCGFVDGWAGRYADTALYTSSETGEQFRGLRYRPENTCYVRDSWVKDSFRAMGWPSSRSQYVHLYINGLYWGLYEPSEHVYASYFARLYGGLEQQWDVLVGEDNNGPPVIVDGSGVDWTNVLSIVNAGITNEAAYQAVDQLVDLDNLIDYMMLHIFSESEDWPRHNWFVAHRRATNGLAATKFTCTVWDQELTLDRLVRRNRVNVGNGGAGVEGEVYSPARVYAQLRAWPEFRLRFADRVQKHLFNGGALMPSNNVARLLASASIISNAVVAESARWGDARSNGVPAGQLGTGKTFTRNEWWQPEIDKLATNFFQKLTADNVARLAAALLYPSNGAPVFNQFGGAVSNGFSLAITHTNASGTVYFTTDGTDPREYGSGAVGATAQAYTTPVPINTPTLVRARVLVNGTWSALVEAMFYPPQDLSKLALTEIMYNPPNVGATNGEEFEFIELKNVGTNTFNLSGLRFINAVDFTFTNGTQLAPGQFWVLARNAAAFASKYPGVTINGIYTGKLDNGGEKLTLAHALGTTIFSVTYDDVAPWPAAADSYGFSLVPKNPGFTQAPDDGTKWRASANIGGSPGADDPTPNFPPIVINEILTHTDLPAVDRVELFNPAATNVNIGGWFLTDDHDVAKKFRISNGTIIPAGGYITFDESQFNLTPGVGTSFSLNSHGEQIYLLSGDANTNLTGYSHGFSFGGAENGVSFGRYINSVGDEQFPAQISQTFNNGNTGPRVGPVVINEIHYHPALGGDEFVELKNITATNVPLFHPAFPTNRWKLDGANFTFPTNVTLPPGGLVLLVATNASSFRAKYSVPTNVPIYTYTGNIQANGERLELNRPDAPDTNGISRIAVDTVRYNDKLPWPAAADGSGASLQRKYSAQYGDDPINWQASAPTPGRENAEVDTDGDGIPDSWESATGTDPLVADSANDDDGDGYTNLQEYFAGTLPRDAESRLRVARVSVGAGAVQLEFNAISNRTYGVQYKNLLEALTWSPLTNIGSAPQNRTIWVNDPATNGTRYYRLTAP